MGGTEKRSWGTAETMGVDCVGRARPGAKECEGRTVRQLSRFWMFKRGGKPVGEGVPLLMRLGMVGEWCSEGVSCLCVEHFLSGGNVSFRGERHLLDAVIVNAYC
jgi:hypothetical protein